MAEGNKKGRKKKYEQYAKIWASMIKKGYSYSQIGKNYGVNAETVRVYVKSLL